MISSMDFVRQSLDIHLFFARIMKEHSFFLEIGFTPKDNNFIQKADDLRQGFDRLLGEVISLSNGVASQEVIRSGEVITPYTQNAEIVTSYFTGIKIPIELTQAEANLVGEGMMSFNSEIEYRVFMINQRAISMISELIQFKAAILSNVLSCKMFTNNYPLLIDHIMREAKLYLRMIQILQNREDTNVEKEALEQEYFWNRIMAEHSKFIRGLLDPTEKTLIKTAENFGREFDQLTKEAKDAIDNNVAAENVTNDSLKATESIRDFKEQGTQGLLNCKIKSIIIPLLSDHVLREASHYLRLLRTFEKVS